MNVRFISVTFLLALVTSLVTAQQVIKLYKDLSDKVFQNTLFRTFRTLGGLISSKYSAKTFEDLLKDGNNFGSVDLKSSVKPVMVTSKNINTGEDFLFSSLICFSSS
jgi:hypothetical protein